MNGHKFQNLGVNLFTRYPGNPILTTNDLAYPANAIFNAGAALVDGETVLLARVEDLRGISHFNVCRSKDGFSDWHCEPQPTLHPDRQGHPEENWGIEDPRVTWLEELGVWAVVYTAYSRRGPQVSLATTKDFKTFERLGSILPPEDKNAALFPRRFGGDWLILHRPVSFGQDPAVWISTSPNLKHWSGHTVLMETRRGAWWDAIRIGPCPPPMETPEGWLFLYHGVRNTAAGAIYRLGLALLDLEDPYKVIRRSEDWVFGPQEPYERVGDVGNVVFSCGWTLEPKTKEIRLYYGAADTCIALATAKLSDVVDYIMKCPAPPAISGA